MAALFRPRKGVEVLLDALEQIDDPETRVQAAIYWLLISPDYAVEL